MSKLLSRRATRRLVARPAAPGLVMLWCLVLAGTGAAAPIHRPDLVVVIAESWPVQPERTATAEPSMTPHLDQLARQGMRFDQYVVNTPQPAAAAATLLTGQYASTRHDRSSPIESEESLGALLTAKGYNCEFAECNAGAPDPALSWAHFQPIGQPVTQPGPAAPRGRTVTDLVVQRLQNRAGRTQPVAILILHRPTGPQAASTAQTSRPDNNPAAPTQFVRKVDQQMGRLLSSLERGDKLKNTILVFTALCRRDSSKVEQSADRDLSFRDESVRVPLLICWPGRIPAGRRSNASISTVDLLPTLCGMVGVGYPDAVEGIDLSDSTRVDCSCEPDFAYLQGLFHAPFADSWRAVRDHRFTYARGRGQESEFLFDNATDPGQSVNLIESSAHQKTRLRMRQWLAEKGLVLKDEFPP